MPEPLLVIGTLAGYAALYAASRRETAVSEEASAVQRGIVEVVQNAERSQAWFGAKALVLSQIQELAALGAEPGWDGEGTEPVLQSAVAAASSFIRALPDRIPLPAVTADPDGAISMDWLVSRHRMFSLSVGPSGRLAYAWLDGTDSGHGVAHFDGMNISPGVLQGIESLMGNEFFALRAA